MIAVTDMVIPARRQRPRRLVALGARRPRTAFVLAGGASLGALQVGMLQALYERGIEPHLLVGTSAGALNAAFVASRRQTRATAKELARIWRGLRREDVFPVSMSTLIGGVRGRRDHLVPDRGLRQLVRRHLAFDDLADASIPLHVVTFDVAGEGEVLLSEGPAVEALVATVSTPGIFPPIELAGRRLIDGGVVNNTPISHAVELGAERIYVLPTQDHRGRSAPVPKTALDAAIYGLGLLSDSRLPTDIARYSHDAELIVFPAPNTAAAQPTSFEHSGRLMQEALLTARAQLASHRVGRHLRLAV